MMAKKRRKKSQADSQQAEPNTGESKSVDLAASE